MRISKKGTMAICLALGTMLFTTTAFAEITTSNGYEQVKDTLKASAENCSSKFDNYTIGTSIAIKDGGNVLYQNDSTIKYDNKNYKQETTASITIEDQKSDNYFYRDKNGYINYDSTQGVYRQMNFEDENKDNVLFGNPFKESGVADVEKIVDALVGNLKDYAIVNQNADGSKEISGSISEAQIPAIINAVVSYEVKNQFANQFAYGYSGQVSKFPKITDDIYVKEIKANVIVDKDGIIQNAVGTGIISGKDEQGSIHELNFEILGKLTDINSTSVNKPDLTGKKVETNTEEEPYRNEITNTEMYIGTYKNDIVIEKDNKFQKIGERIVDITQIDDKAITGRYHDEYNKGYEEYSKDAVDINFSANLEEEQKNSARFINEDTNANNKSGNIYINPNSSSIYFYIDNTKNINNNNGQFDRVFN